MTDNESQEIEDGRPRLVAVLAALGVILAAGVVMLAFMFDRPAAGGMIEIHPPPITPTGGATVSLAPLTVYVTGAVKAPGVVRVDAGARVEDAVAAAGGTNVEADLLRCNMAALLRDGQHIHVPAVGEAVPGSIFEGESEEEQIININSATADELTALPGVGEATAAKIVAYRSEHGPFTSIEEIMEVPGIGKGKFDGFAGRITVGP
jgi:competence protein ComEA